MIDSVKTGFNRFCYGLVALPIRDGTVVVVGQQDGACKLERVNMKERREIFSGKLTFLPQGLT